MHCYNANCPLSVQISFEKRNISHKCNSIYARYINMWAIFQKCVTAWAHMVIVNVFPVIIWYTCHLTGGRCIYTQDNEQRKKITLTLHILAHKSTWFLPNFFPDRHNFTWFFLNFLIGCNIPPPHTPPSLRPWVTGFTCWARFPGHNNLQKPIWLFNYGYVPQHKAALVALYNQITGYIKLNYTIQYIHTAYEN